MVGTTSKTCNNAYFDIYFKMLKRKTYYYSTFHTLVILISAMRRHGGARVRGKFFSILSPCHLPRGFDYPQALAYLPLSTGL